MPDIKSCIYNIHFYLWKKWKITFRTLDFSVILDHNIRDAE